MDIRKITTSDIVASFAFDEMKHHLIQVVNDEFDSYVDTTGVKINYPVYVMNRVFQKWCEIASLN